MASNTRLLYDGNPIYLNGRGSYTGSGTPWSAQNTTPFLLSMNDVTGNIYTPSPAPTVPVLGGGPPLRSGRSLISKSYDVVTESVGIQLYASTFDNAVKLLQLLRQALSTALYSSPCILIVQPDGATFPTCYEILYADVPEMPSYLEEKTSTKRIFRATITWTRTIGFSGTPVNTGLDVTTMQDRSSGSPDDVEAMTVASGDLIYEGQPLNVKIRSTTDTFARFYLAAIEERVNTSISQAKTTSTSTTYTTATPTISTARNRNLKVRILARFTTFTNPGKIRLQAFVRDGGLGLNLIKTSAILSLPAGASTVSTLLDFGYVDLPTRSIFASTLALNIQFSLQSSDGTSVTATLDYVETLLYRTFASIDNAALGNGVSLVSEAINDYNTNGIWVPNSVPRCYTIVTSTGVFLNPIAYRGTLPRAFSGGSLYVAWLKSASVTNDTHSTSDTVAVTADYMPMLHSLRGS